jgi:hypothetical protein
MHFSDFGNFDINQKWDVDQILKKLNFLKLLVTTLIALSMVEFSFLNQILIFLTQKFQLEVPYNSTQSDFFLHSDTLHDYEAIPRL